MWSSVWPRKGIRRAAAIASLVLVAVSFTFWSVRHFVGARQGVAPARPTGRKAAIATRVIATALIDLEVRTLALRELEPHIEARAGAILSFADRVVVADSNGQFWEVSALDSAKPRIDRIPLQLQLNKTANMNHFAGGRGGTVYPARVTDLLLLGPGPLVAVSYAHWDPDRACLTQRVSTVTLPAAGDSAAGSSPQWRLIYTSKPCLASRSGHETGGRMWKTGDNTILVTVGHFGGRYNDLIMRDPGVDLGKLIEINVMSDPSRAFTRGHRNAQGLTGDRRGRLWLTEHGQRGGDELNLIREGRNYGWPFVTLGTAYDARSWPLSKQQGRHEGFEKPVFAWGPGIGISNLIELDGFHERWDGDLLVLSLNGRSLHRLRLNGDHVIYEERVRVGERLRDIARSDDGSLVVWTDNANLLRISASDDTAPVEQRIAKMGPALREVLTECAGCHGMSREAGNTERISLWAVTGKQAPQSKAGLYSKAMLEKKPRWNDEQLNELLADPQRFVPGTTMEFPGVADAELRRDVIEFLKSLR